MRKLALFTIEYPPQIGGVANYYANLVAAWPEPITVYTAAELPKRWLQMIPWLWRMQSREQFTGWFVGQLLPLGTVAYLVNKLTRTPYVVFVHGMDVLIPQQSFRKRWLMRRILRNAKQIVAASTFTADLVTQFDASLKDCITVVHPAPHITNAISPVQPSTPLPQHFVLSVGRLVERKGFDRVIACLPHVPDVHYVIAGDGAYKATLLQLAQQLAVADRVHIMSGLSDAEVAYLYQHCIVFAMPSKTVGKRDVEGYGTVVVEANSFGKVAIGGKYSGMRDAIQDSHTGVLVDSQASLLAALKTLVGNKPYRETLELAAKQFAQDQTWPKRVEQLLGLWK